jgi:hypothetical protein
MSYPKNLGTKLNYLTNYSTNSVKLNMDNSITELNNITSGARMQFTMPPNSLIDLSSFSVHALFETTPATRQNGAGRPHYLTRNVMSMVRRLTVEIGGQTVSDIQDYNLINQIFSDYQFGIEGSSKKLSSNSDPLLKTNLIGEQKSALCAITDNAQNANLILDNRPICLSQFLGFLGGGAGIKYLDTQLTGTIQITMELAPASHILWYPEAIAVDGVGAILAGDPNNNGLTPPTYKLSQVYVTIKKCSIDDGVYFASVASALQAGIPFEYKYNHFQTTKSNLTDGNLTMQYEIMSNSVDSALMTSYVCNDDTFVSGFNANGVPLTLSVETTAHGGAPNDKVGQLFVMTSEVLQVYAGRQVNRVK